VPNKKPKSNSRVGGFGVVVVVGWPLASCELCLVEHALRFGYARHLRSQNAVESAGPASTDEENRSHCVRPRRQEVRDSTGAPRTVTLQHTGTDEEIPTIYLAAKL